uniref:Sperm associated antigen 1a n=1 Tax=Oryzias latipes TaxID=8090 RepID=H2LC53_ORYLA
MGNAQEKPPGGGGGAKGAHHGGPAGGKPQNHKAPEKGLSNGSPQDNNSPAGRKEEQASPAVDTSYLDAPAGALPPHLARLKNEGNHLFKHGQFGEALGKYTQAIEGCAEAGVDSPDDLCILYSNRAACYLKDGNSADCIQDCTKALELQPYSLKPLLRRAMAYESLERYRKAYVDYKTVLQMDTGIQAAHDNINKMEKRDGPEWREKLPEIPAVPLSVQQQHREKPASIEQAQQLSKHQKGDKNRVFLIQEARFSLLKQEGNGLVKKGLFQEALQKYSELCGGLPFSSRAICYLKLLNYEEAKQDCDSAIRLDPTNKKAFYRRALAFKGLQVIKLPPSRLLGLFINLS